MICPPGAVFDTDAVARALAARIDRAPDDLTRRTETAAVLRAARQSALRAIGEAFGADPLDARGATRAYAYLTDCLTDCAFRAASEWLHPRPNPTEGERLSLLATGGYGRAEMAPIPMPICCS